MLVGVSLYLTDLTYAGMCYFLLITPAGRSRTAYIPSLSPLRNFENQSAEAFVVVALRMQTDS